jgi:hypothetical protein
MTGLLLRTQIRPAILLAVVLLLTGCLTSEQPLFQTSDFPLPTGTSLMPLKHQGAQYVDEGPEKALHLAIEDGGYVLKLPEDDQRFRFKLHAVQERAWAVMVDMEDQQPRYVYGLLRQEGERYLLQLGNAEKFRSWAAQNQVRQNWSAANGLIQLTSLELLTYALPNVVKPESDTGTLAFRTMAAPSVATTEEGLDQETIDRVSEFVDAKIIGLERKQRELCGGRICTILDDGTILYRTDTYKPPRWYYRDGRLAPTSVWPE